MEIKTIVVPPLDTNCYIITDNGVSACIDPGGDAEGILSLADGRLDLIILTHGHFDHIGAVAELREKTGAKVLIHTLDAPMLSDARKSLASVFKFAHTNAEYDRLVEDGDEVVIGSSVFTVIHTPGHSKGSISLYTNGFLFCGDTIFRGTIGRFNGRDKEAMQGSIRRLLSLPDDTKVYPGHEAPTTIAYEKEYNPFSNFEWTWE